ncbi:hypothetical protein [Rhodococcus sp. X156]|uniref:hypothetical protein n=1 Tax=Rhodococcus sp. X156 TaxID=2499145 RepID=UPI001F49D81A|nr:hypothetical protein [Rhodococcus sp. X156]
MAVPAVSDLAGLLVAHGQAFRAGGRTRVSVVLDAPWRAVAVAELVRETGLTAETDVSEQGAPLVRTGGSDGLAALGRAWTKGAVKAVPRGWVPDGRALRAWALAAGRCQDNDYVLGLDPHAPDTHQAAAAALARAGLASILLGARGGGPSLRVSGRRRVLRLSEMLGSAPSAVPASGYWPVAKR